MDQGFPLLGSQLFPIEISSDEDSLTPQSPGLLDRFPSGRVHGQGAVGGFSPLSQGFRSVSTAFSSGSISTATVPGSVSTAAVPGSVSTAAASGSVSTAAVPGSVSTAAVPGSVSTAAASGSVSCPNRVIFRDRNSVVANVPHGPILSFDFAQFQPSNAPSPPIGTRYGLLCDTVPYGTPSFYPFEGGGCFHFSFPDLCHRSVYDPRIVVLVGADLATFDLSVFGSCVDVTNKNVSIPFPNGGSAFVADGGQVFFQCGEKGMLPLTARRGCYVDVPRGGVVNFVTSFDQLNNGLLWSD